METYSYRRFKEIPEDLRPREKLKRLGAEFLSDEELLAIILRTGTRKADLMKLSKTLISLGWKKLEELSIEELKKVEGLGEVKAIEIKALLEISKRIHRSLKEEKIKNPKDAFSAVKDLFDKNKETLVALYLDLGNRVLRREVIAIGSINTVFSQPRDILKPALEVSAFGIIVAHNHPGGEAEPSREDIEFTERLKKACEILGFELLDHIIVDDSKFVSLKERGII